MTTNVGTHVSSKIVPPDSADSFPTHDSAFGIGGYREVASPGDLGGIPLARRRAGMMVCAVSDGSLWRLSSDLSTWVDDNASKPVSTAQQAALNSKIASSEKASPNGVATLDSSGKVPTSQIPAVPVEITVINGGEF